MKKSNKPPRAPASSVNLEFLNKFILLQGEMKMILESRSKYGQPDDPLANLNACKAMGIAPHCGCFIRATDKVTRIHSLLREGDDTRESLKDNLLDLANYCLLTIMLMEEKDVTTKKTIREHVPDIQLSDDS